MTSRRLRAAQRREALETPQYGWIWKPLLVVLIVALVVMVGLGVWWSKAPKAFDVEAVTEQQRQSSSPAGRGVVTVATLKQLLDTLQNKPGGYLRDDVLPPGLVMDNMPSWEWGVLQQAQIMSHQLASFDPQTAPTVEALDAAMRGNADNWILPSTGKKLAAASGQVGDYLVQFDQASGAAFAANGQGLAAWLSAVRTKLAPLTERLSASVGDADMLKELGIAVPEFADVPWYRVDNDLHQARGQSWALSRLMAAMLRDQRDVIESAGMLDHWQRAQAELERTQRHLWSPVVLRGSGFGIFANYPLTMAHHLSRIDASLTELEAGLAIESSESSRSEPSAAEQPSAMEEQEAPAKEASPEAEQGAPAEGASPEAEQDVPAEEVLPEAEQGAPVEEASPEGQAAG